MGEVKVKISSDGSKVVVDVNGVTGSSCTDITTKLIGALGGTNKEHLKPEYYEVPVEVSLNVSS